MREVERRPWYGAAFVAYLVVLAVLTLKPRFGVSGSITPNFVPFASVSEMLSGPASAMLIAKNLLGNLLLLAPLAWFLREQLAWSGERVLIACAATSAVIEVLQGSGLFAGRGLNVDDLLLNTMGAGLVLLLLIGYKSWGRPRQVTPASR